MALSGAEGQGGLSSTGAFGDSFGPIAGIFSALAFVVALFALREQGRDLVLTQFELRRSADEQERLADIQEKATAANALSVQAQVVALLFQHAFNPDDFVRLAQRVYDASGEILESLGVASGAIGESLSSLAEEMLAALADSDTGHAVVANEAILVGAGGERGHGVPRDADTELALQELVHRGFVYQASGNYYELTSAGTDAAAEVSRPDRYSWEPDDTQDVEASDG